MAKRSRFTIKTKEIVIEPLDESDIWEGEWTITIFADNKPVNIGKASFAGEKLLGAVPIKLELEEKYQNKGYGTRVFQLMTEFAFGFKNIYEVKADTSSDNERCVYALEKAGFVRRKKEGREEQYSIIKQQTSWLALYLYIGFIAGILIGIVINIMWAGLVIGLVIGLFIGSMMDVEARKSREKITGSKNA